MEPASLPSAPNADPINATSARLPPGRLAIEPMLALLIAEGWLDDAEAERARVSAQHSRRSDVVHPLVLLANLKLQARQPTGTLLSLERLTEWTARHSCVPYLRIDPTKVDVGSVGGLVSQAYAQRHRILPVEVHDDRVVIATSEPNALDWLPDIQHLLRKQVEVVMANPLDVQRLSTEFFSVTRSVRGARDLRGDNLGLPSFEQLVELGRTGDVNADDSHIVHIVDWLLQYAHEQRASDIHMEPRRDISRVRFRIDGVLHKVFELPTPVMVGAVSRIKVLGRMDLAERRRPQDGRIKTRSPGGREVEMRLSTMPTAFGEKCVLRLFDPDTAFKPIEQLGFDAEEARLWWGMVERPHGIVLVTGPTGSGKTTTLYSTLRQLARPEVNVCTVEDPIEMIAPELNQMQVHHGIDLGFATGVRTLLRQDPDVIMIGEIRDLDTAQMAVQASLTGHLVLSTLHTNDAPSAITRLLDLGLPHYLIASTLNGVLAQRLVRTLCPHCKQPQPVPREDWQALLGPEGRIPASGNPHGPVGCLECRNTGYYGRVGLYEILPVTPAVRDAIHADTDLAAFSQIAVQQGLRTLRMAGAEKVAQGLTTIAEVIAVLPPRE